MGGGPVFVVAFGVLAFGLVFGWTALWVLAGVAFVALAALLLAMYRRGTFVGPRVVVDEAVDRFSLGAGESGPSDEVYEVRRVRGREVDDDEV